MENKPNGCRISDPCTFSAFTYIIIVHCQTWFDLLFSIIINCVTYSVLYENLTCSVSTLLNSPGKTWKMDINGSGKSWKTHIKRYWKVMENHFQCSVRTLYICFICLLLLVRERSALATIKFSRRVYLSGCQDVCLSDFSKCFFSESFCPIELIF